VVPLEEFRINMTICYDLRFPELYRAALAEGANLISVQANWPAARQRQWEILLKARAVENQAFVIGINRVGKDGKLNYNGGSLILDPQGKTIAKADKSEGISEGIIDITKLKKWRKDFPVLNDRKPLSFFNPKR